MNDPLAITLSRELSETSDCGEILGISRRLEFRVGQSQIIAVKMRILLQCAGQQTAAQRPVGQGAEARFPAIGQELDLDLALEQIIRRLHDMQLRDAAKSFDLGRREIAYTNSADLPLLEEGLHRRGGFFDRY